MEKMGLGVLVLCTCLLSAVALVFCVFIFHIIWNKSFQKAHRIWVTNTIITEVFLLLVTTGKIICLFALEDVSHAALYVCGSMLMVGLVVGACNMTVLVMEKYFYVCHAIRYNQETHIKFTVGSLILIWSCAAGMGGASFCWPHIVLTSFVPALAILLVTCAFIIVLCGALVTQTTWRHIREEYLASVGYGSLQYAQSSGDSGDIRRPDPSRTNRTVKTSAYAGSQEAHRSSIFTVDIQEIQEKEASDKKNKNLSPRHGTASIHVSQQRKVTDVNKRSKGRHEGDRVRVEHGLDQVHVSATLSGELADDERSFEDHEKVLCMSYRMNIKSPLPVDGSSGRLPGEEIANGKVMPNTQRTNSEFAFTLTTNSKNVPNRASSERKNFFPYVRPTSKERCQSETRSAFHGKKAGLEGPLVDSPIRRLSAGQHYEKTIGPDGQNSRNRNTISNFSVPIKSSSPKIRTNKQCEFVENANGPSSQVRNTCCSIHSSVTLDKTKHIASKKSLIYNTKSSLNSPYRTRPQASQEPLNGCAGQNIEKSSPEEQKSSSQNSETLFQSYKGNRCTSQSLAGSRSERDGSKTYRKSDSFASFDNSSHVYRSARKDRESSSFMEGRSRKDYNSVDSSLNYSTSLSSRFTSTHSVPIELNLRVSNCDFSGGHANINAIDTYVLQQSSPKTAGTVLKTGNSRRNISTVEIETSQNKSNKNISITYSGSETGRVSLVNARESCSGAARRDSLPPVSVVWDEGESDGSQQSGRGNTQTHTQCVQETSHRVSMKETRGDQRIQVQLSGRELFHDNRVNSLETEEHLKQCHRIARHRRVKCIARYIAQMTLFLTNTIPLFVVIIWQSRDGSHKGFQGAIALATIAWATVLVFGMLLLLKYGMMTQKCREALRRILCCRCATRVTPLHDVRSMTGPESHTY